jgi:hypothetical protein
MITFAILLTLFMLFVIVKAITTLRDECGTNGTEYMYDYYDNDNDDYI